MQSQMVLQNHNDKLWQDSQSDFPNSSVITKSFSTNHNQKNNLDDSSDDQNHRPFLGFAKSSTQMNRFNNDRSIGLSYEITQIRRREKIDFMATLSQISEMSNTKETDFSLKTELLEGMRALLQERISDEESFRHKMLKEKASKKQWQHNSSVLTKTTAANSISSSVPNNPNNQVSALLNQRKLEDDGQSNTTSHRTSISINNLSEISAVAPVTRTLPDQYNLELAKKQCVEQSAMIKSVEQALIPLKNERNQILEKLEDIKEDLIVSKQYLREITDVMEKKKVHSQNLMVKINQLSRSGLSTLNRDYLSQSHIQQLNSTRMMNASFVDDAVEKFKAVKDFFKGKFSSSSTSSNSNTANSAQPTAHNYGFQSSRSNSQSQLPMTNRFLDFI